MLLFAAAFQHGQCCLRRTHEDRAGLYVATGHASGRTNVYAIGLAGWSEQNVFVKELDGGLKSLSAVLPLDGHVIRLINNVDTAGNTPIASLQNFATAVHAIARAMDRERDVLLLFMTSHGSPDGVALRLTGELYTDLSPRDVAMILDSEGITNRIVIVSACYSGVFLKPLANDDSIVLTAADADHPSFGCSDERERTWQTNIQAAISSLIRGQLLSPSRPVSS